MRRALTAASLALALTCAAFAACTSTVGVPITAQLRLEPTDEPTTITPRGWRVELTEAIVLVGPIYAYAPADEPMAWRAPFGPPRARAHGGFDPLDGRLVRAEYLDQVAFDALGEPLDVGAIGGLRGAASELSVVLDAPRDAFAAADGPTRGHHLWVRGSATRDDVTVEFEGGLDLPDEDLTRRDRKSVV